MSKDSDRSEVGVPNAPEDYVDEQLGWRIQITPSADFVDYIYTNLETGAILQGGALKRAFRPPSEVIAAHLNEQKRLSELARRGVLGEQISRRIMEMVGALHRRGYESLYLDPVMAPNGTSWRYQVGAMVERQWPNPAYPRFANSAEACVGGSIRGGPDQEIPWAHATDSVGALSDKFAASYPEIVKAARSPNSEYVSWYREMLERTAPAGALLRIRVHVGPTPRLSDADSARL